MDPSQLIQGRSRETRIRRDASGRWFDGDEALDRPSLVRAFNEWIEVAPDGRYCLRNAINWAYVAIEGAPLFVESLRLEGGKALLRLSNGAEEALAPGTLRQDPEGMLYCDVRGGAMTARFARLGAQQLADALGEDDEGVYVELGGQRFYPPVVDQPLSTPRPTL